MELPVVLVTGGTGLVGNAIRKYIQNTNTNYAWHFVGRDLPLTGAYTAVDKYFSIVRPRYVIHLAAQVGGLYKNARSKLQMYQDNMTINDNILRACAQFNVKKVVLCLSTCVYPDKIDYPFEESSLHNGPPHLSNEGYAYAKRMVELQARLYNQLPNAPKMLCVIPTNIYGPHDNFNLEDSHVIPGLIHRCYLAKRDNTPFTIRGTGKAIRQFIHADDIAHFIIRVLLEKDPSDMPHGVILAPPPDTEVTIGDVVNAIAEAFEMPPDSIQYDPSFSDGQIRKTASNKLLQQLFPEDVNHFQDLKTGIKSTVEWFKTNYAFARK
jgi:GDP-L-fucose synthase